MNENELISRRKAIIVCLIFLSGVAICTLHTFLSYQYPEIEVEKYVLWADKDYKEELTIAWYMYELENLLCVSIWFFAFWLAIKNISTIIARVCFIFMLYFLTQTAFYIYNRNTSDISNNIVYIYIILAVIYIFIPPKQGGKIINLNQQL